MRRTTLISAFLLMALGFALPGHAAEQIFDRTVPLASTGSFALRNVNGAVSVIGWDQNAVAVHAVKTGGDDILLRLRIDLVAGPDAVSVTSIFPQDETGDMEVSYTVHVPRHALLRQVTTVNGVVRISGVERVGELGSVNGDIDVSDSSGAFAAHTTNGNIHMTLAKLDGSGTLRAQTVNGSIALAIPRDASALVEAASLNGDFRSDLPYVVATTYKSRRIDALLGPGGATVRLRTVNGAIRLLELRKGIS